MCNTFEVREIDSKYVCFMWPLIIRAATDVYRMIGRKPGRRPATLRNFDTIYLETPGHERSTPGIAFFAAYRLQVGFYLDAIITARLFTDVKLAFSGSDYCVLIGYSASVSSTKSNRYVK